MQARQQPLRLTTVAKNVGVNALVQVMVHSLGLAAANIFALSAAAAIESWSAFMAVTITGAFALYLPTWGLKKLLNSLSINTPLITDIIDLAYIISSPVVGALILNWMLGWTIPIVACLACAAVGGGVSLLLGVMLPRIRNNQTPGTQQQRNQTQESRTTQPNNSNAAGNENARPRIVHSIFVSDSFEVFATDPFFNVGRSNTNQRTHQSSTSSDLVIEEIDDNGNVIGEIPRTNNP